MKVLNVNMSLDPVTGGGSVERTVQMTRYLARNNSECTILTTDYGLTSERMRALEGAGINVIAFPCMIKRFYIPKISYKSVINAVENVDIIHIMNHWTFINALVYFVARRLGKPYVVCPAGSLSIYGRSKLLKKIYNWVIGKKIIRNAERLIAITEDEKFAFRDYGVNLCKVDVIPNGIDPDDYSTRDDTDFRNKYGLGQDPILLFVGRLNHIKGPDLLLQAFCNMGEASKPFRLVFVGPDGGMLPSLRRMAHESGVGDRVHFIGYLGSQEKSKAYHASDLLVIPSRKEAMSIVLLEAGITRTPVLLTDQCGFNELSECGAGDIVPATAEGLQEGLTRLLKHPGELRSLGERLYELVHEKFAWNTIVDNYLNIYDIILRKR